MQTVTREEWNRKHADYKTVDEEGQHYVLQLDPETGATVLVPMEIVEEDSDG